MKTQSRALIIFGAPLAALLIIAGTSFAPAAESTPYPHLQLMKAESSLLPLDPFRAPPAPADPQPIDWPEYYIDPTVEHGLNMILPSPVRNGLEVEAFYDRWEGLPTLQAEYLHMIRGWHDKSLFVTPRVSVTSTREGFSVGGGFRQMVNSRALVGFHVFHDWVRPRGSTRQFLRQAGIGVEVSALPGLYSDLTIAANAYLPINERFSVVKDGSYLLRESLPVGGDLSVGFQFPAVVDYFDARVDARGHRYQGAFTDSRGYDVSFSLNSRDGLLGATLAQSRENDAAPVLSVNGTLTLAFDWQDLLDGKNPFSAPYEPGPRFTRNLKESLYEKANRKKDLSTDQSLRRIALATRVWGDTVAFGGGFPSLPNSRLTVQTSQSPWVDQMEVVTDSKGFYSGQITLAPGRYRIRLIHRESGAKSRIHEVVVEEDRSEGF